MKEKRKHGAIIRKADVCPFCGAVESFRVYRTLQIPHDRRICRYCVCKKCGSTVVKSLRY